MNHCQNFIICMLLLVKAHLANSQIFWLKRGKLQTNITVKLCVRVVFICTHISRDCLGNNLTYTARIIKLLYGISELRRKRVMIRHLDLIRKLNRPRYSKYMENLCRNCANAGGFSTRSCSSKREKWAIYQYKISEFQSRKFANFEFRRVIIWNWKKIVWAILVSNSTRILRQENRLKKYISMVWGVRAQKRLADIRRPTRQICTQACKFV